MYLTLKGVKMKKDIVWSSENPEKKQSGEICGGENAGSSDHNQVTSSSNRIYFYSEVSRPKNLELNKMLVDTSDALKSRLDSFRMEGGEIFLHINSYGGSVMAGLSSVDYIRNSRVPVTTVIDGCAASAATLMSVVGARRLMHRHAYMLVHQLSSGLWGKYEELKDDMENCDNFMKIIKKIYQEHTNIPKTKLDQILKHDLWWDAETCLKYGLIDEII